MKKKVIIQQCVKSVGERQYKIQQLVNCSQVFAGNSPVFRAGDYIGEKVLDAIIGEEKFEVTINAVKE